MLDLKSYLQLLKSDLQLLKKLSLAIEKAIAIERKGRVGYVNNNKTEAKR